MTYTFHFLLFTFIYSSLFRNVVCHDLVTTVRRLSRNILDETKVAPVNNCKDCPFRVASLATSEERNEKREQGSQQQGFQWTKKMWTKCQRLGSRSFYFCRASHIADCQRSEGPACTGIFCQLHLFLTKMDLKELRTANCQEHGNLEKCLPKLLGMWTDEYWL